MTAADYYARHAKFGRAYFSEAWADYWLVKVVSLRSRAVAFLLCCGSWLHVQHLEPGDCIDAYLVAARRCVSRCLMSRKSRPTPRPCWCDPRSCHFPVPGQKSITHNGLAMTTRCAPPFRVWNAIGDPATAATASPHSACVGGLGMAHCSRGT